MIFGDLTWQPGRRDPNKYEEPDPALKGQPQGNCNRTACQVPLIKGKTWYNRATSAYYCRHCAHLINRANRDTTPPLCTEDLEAGREQDLV